MAISKKRKEQGLVVGGVLLALILMFLFARLVAHICVSGLNLIFG
ncbi:hypothetical protein [Sphingomonas sp.]